MLNGERKGMVLVISSPSGAGKTTISKKLIKQVKDLDLSISVTTRIKRIGEIEGKDYFFRNNEEFKKMMLQGEFLETANVFGYFYGTLKKEIIAKIQNGIDVIVDIDWQGTRKISQHIPEDIVKVFILPPSIGELNKRLGLRATESNDSFRKRMSEAKKEISHYSEYDFVLINNEIDDCVNKIKSIIYSERLRRIRQKNLEKFVYNLT